MYGAKSVEPLFLKMQFASTPTVFFPRGVPSIPSQRDATLGAVQPPSGPPPTTVMGLVGDRALNSLRFCCFLWVACLAYPFRSAMAAPTHRHGRPRRLGPV